MRRSFRNPLVRRLRRHYNLATLFRSPESQRDIQDRRPRPRVSSSRSSQPGMLKSKAFLPGRQTSWNAADVVQRLPEEGALHTAAPEPATTHPASGANHAPFRGQKTTQPSSLIQRGQAERPDRPPEPETSEDFDDSLWRRLQTIFNKHRTKAATQEGEASLPDLVPPSDPRQASKKSLTVEAAITPAKGETAHVETPAGTGERGSPDALEAQELEHPPEVHTPETIHRRSDLDEKKRPVAPDPMPGQLDELVSEGHDPVSAPAQTAGGSITTQASETSTSEFEAQGLSLLKEPGEPDTGNTVQTMPGKGPVRKQEAGVEAEATSEGPEAGLEPQNEANDLPLQAVWPVQARRPEPGQSVEPSDVYTGEGSDTVIGEPSSPPVAAEEYGESGEVSHAPQSGDIIQRALGKVKSGQPSDSSIELLPPRRPRPGAQLQSKRSGGSALDPDSSKDPNNAELSRAGPGPLQEGPEDIPTEIGPLPPDLWGLIGEPLPGSLASGPASVPAPGTDKGIQPAHALTESQTQSPDVQPARDKQAQVLEPDRARLSYQAAVQSHMTTAGMGVPRLVQRALDPRASAPQAPTRGTAQEEASDQAEQPDIDELARQVYEVVKRRFALERERIRRPY